MTSQWILDMGGRQHIANPRWDQIRQALWSMDGDSLDSVGIRLEGKGGLLAGGGNDGRYLVISSSEAKGQRSLTLTDPSLKGPDVVLQIQTEEAYRARYCVKLPLVLKVFEHFFRTGELPKDVRWEIDTTGEEARL